MRLGIDRLIKDPDLQRALAGRRLAFLGHPASMNSLTFEHSLNALGAISALQLTAAFGPQHGMRGDKQDNMNESDDYLDPHLKIPVYSLYGKHRRPTADMLDTFDILLVDLQDVGTRVYTYLATVLYVLEACAQYQKSIWLLDRPNPAGRPVEGSRLVSGQESFVGCTTFPMRHGLTLGEAAQWLVANQRLDVDLKVIAMTDYRPEQGPGFGWPSNILPWVNPSPNLSSLNAVRCYPGTVLIEGTTLSEGRGTSVPLEIIGAPNLDIRTILSKMDSLAVSWMKSCCLRPVFFEPNFNKHTGCLCQGIQIHTDFSGYHPDHFKPYRLIALLLKSIRLLYPDYELWRDFHYEYESDHLAVDVINGGPALREWVDDPNANCQDLDALLQKDEAEFLEVRQKFFLY